MDHYDEEEDEPVTEDIDFKKGEIVDFDILQEDAEQYKEIQFVDGAMAYGVPKNLFKEVGPGFGESSLAAYPTVSRILAGKT